MTQQIINVGTGPDSYTGDTLRTAFEKTNSNFNELYAMSGISSNADLSIHSLTTTANVTAAHFIGDGSQLTGIVSGTSYSNSNVASYLPIYSGNINAAYYFGDGSHLTGIVSNSTYSNSNVASYLPTYSGNVNAAYYFGDGSHLTGVTANLGNLFIDGEFQQTITGSAANTAIVIKPSAGSKVAMALEYDNSGIEQFLSFSSPLPTSNVINIFTSNTNSLVLSANGAVIGLDPVHNRIGFNTTTPGYDFTFNGELAARAMYARADFPVGYSFTTPLGLTGLTHTYQNDINGNISLVKISHDNATPAKFYENNTTILSGNLVVTADNAVGTFPNAFIQTYSNINSYSQMVLQNINSGDQASFDIILTADNGNDSQMFADFGIASSTYNFPGYGAIKPNDVYLLAVGDNITGPGSAGGPDLLMGSTTGNINLFVGAPEDANIIAQFNDTGLTTTGTFAADNGSGMKTIVGNEEIQAVYNGTLIYSLAKGPGGGSIFTEADKSFAIMANTGNSMWTFGTAGNLEYPDGTTTTGAVINAPTAPADPIAGILTISLESPFTNPLVVLDGTNTIPDGSQIIISGLTNPAELNGTWYAGFYNSTTIRIFSDPAMTITPDASGWAGYTGGGTVFYPPVLKDFAITTFNGNAVWYFGSDGNLSLPFSASPGPTISGGIRFGDGSFQQTAANTNAIINGNTSVYIDGPGGNIAFQRLGSNYGHIGTGLAIGYIAGDLNQGTSAVALGTAAGYSGQSANAVAIGTRAGQYTQGENAVAVGIWAGNTSQGGGAVAIGPEAGKTSQGVQGTAMGIAAGSVSQGNGSVAVGSFAGQYNQKDFAIAIGSGAAANSQGYGAIAIGVESTTINQGDYSIAIGFTASNGNIQPNNSIIIDATNSQLAATGPGLFVAPVRASEGANVSLSYNTSTKEITYSANTFVSNTYVPSTASSAGTQGQITFDGNYVYICVGTNSWKRANLSAW